MTSAVSRNSFQSAVVFVVEPSGASPQDHPRDAGKARERPSKHAPSPARLGVIIARNLEDPDIRVGAHLEAIGVRAGTTSIDPGNTHAMEEIHMKNAIITAVAVAVASGSVAAQTINFDFEGNAGVGLLPDNEVGSNTSFGSGSPAIGGEVGAGLVFDTSTSTLNFDFQFSGLTGGLFDAASGIHFHIASPGIDPFNETGGIAYNLNSGTDSAVTNTNALLATDGSVSSGRVTGFAVIRSEDVDDLLAGNFYLNIHSDAFRGGELRANLVPAPGAAAMLGLGGLVAARRRR
ncbi:MAG: CHRD domain-containing protein [Phycisphaerales bacterium]